MASTRMLGSKLTSFVGSSSTNVARPMLRSSIKPQFSQRAFSGATQGARSDARSAFQTMKRQQLSNIINANTRNMMGRQSTRAYSSEIASAMVEVSKNLGMGSAAIGLGGAGIGIGMVFAALLMAVARNPSMRGQLFAYAILGFAFVEAIGLFDLMVAMMCKYV